LLVAHRLFEVIKVSVELYDLLLTIKRGHELQIKLQLKIQSRMFPFIDINRSIRQVPLVLSL
jgi:hypothetical protein